MDGTTAAVGDLITEAIQLVDHPHHESRSDVLALVRDQLVVAATSCPDGALAADANDVVAQLDQLLRGFEHSALPLAS